MAYTPRQTQDYERQIRMSFAAKNTAKFEKKLPLEVQILACFPVPQNTGKKLKEAMLTGEILPTKRPDSDNIIKIILDALNGFAYHDDAQICRICFAKMYAEKPETKVLIKNIEGT